MKHTPASLRRRARGASQRLTVKVELSRQKSMLVDEAAYHLGLDLPEWYESAKSDPAEGEYERITTHLSRRDALLICARLMEQSNSALGFPKHSADAVARIVGKALGLFLEKIR